MPLNATGRLSRSQNAPRGSPDPRSGLDRRSRPSKIRSTDTVEVLLQHPDAPLFSVCFHAQQYLEKALKAILVSNGIVFRRTHALGVLAELFAQHGLKPPLPAEQLTRLNPCAVLLRYLDTSQDIPFESISADEVWSILDASRRWLKEQTATEM